MCGIIGEIQRTHAINLDKFNELRDLMYHRGPDGAGTELLNDSKIAFGHRRLSIIDLSNHAKQPMCNEDGSVWITFNGEIYNYRELKAELINKHDFKSNSDTEVLIHGYEEWGLEVLLNKLKGMFAFGLWDQKNKKLIVARDRFGIKPLLYSYSENQFLFSSELKSIANHPKFDKELDDNSIADYFTYSYVPFPNTIWKSAYKLPPAHYAELDTQDFSLTIKEYWKLVIDSKKLDFDEALFESNRLIEIATKQHLESDVPIGLFLSGGYDSNTLLINMLDLGYKPDAYTVAFPGSENNEIEQAAAVAKHFGLNHYIEEIPRETNVVDILEELAPYYDEPFAGSSMINNHLIAKLAGRQLKVAFSGEGADEVYGGYKWHRKIESYYKESWFKRAIKNIIDGNVNPNSVFLALYNRSMIGVLNDVKINNVLHPELIHCMRRRGLWHFRNHLQVNHDKVKQTQFLDYKTFIPNHCLQRSDMSSMVNSLEVRVPFLDHEIFEFMFSLDRSVYMKPGKKKVLMENKLKNRIPDSVLNMPKRGFSFHYSGKNFDSKVSSIFTKGKLVEHGIIKSQRVKANYISDNLKFHLVNLENWFEYHHG
jgi:asparagine synthase (glutamine-hydrolysing)